jgi:hypothetical protein
MVAVLPSALGNAEGYLLPGMQAGEDGCQCLGVAGSSSVDRGEDVSGLQAPPWPPGVPRQSDCCIGD